MLGPNVASKDLGGEKSAKGGKGKKGAEGTKKGEAIGDEMLLAGLGFSATDKSKAKKNVAEKSNIQRFLQDPKGQLKKMAKKETAEAKQDTQKNKDAPKDAKPVEKTEHTEQAREQHEARNEEARVQGQDQQEPKEMREKAEAREAQQQQNRERDRDEEGKGAGGWVLEDADQDEDDRRGSRNAYSIEESDRCYGHQDDGSRCLRKSDTGSPFCGEHKVLGHIATIDKI